MTTSVEVPVASGKLRAACRFWLLFMVLAFTVFAADGKNLDIGLVTMDRGDVLWQHFGHNALVVVDHDENTSKLYNYGLFDFDQDDFLLRFVRGSMLYSMAAVRPERGLAIYQHEQRSVKVQWLDLTDAQASGLQTFLEWNQQPENADYRYDYLLDNCSTRVRDALDQVLGGQLARQWSNMPYATTWRMEAARHMGSDWLYKALIDIAFGRDTDQTLTAWQAAFIPETLAQLVQSQQVDGKDLVKRAESLLSFDESWPTGSSQYQPTYFALVGIAMAFLLVATRRSRFGKWLRLSWWSATGAIGVALLGFWAFSGHWVTWNNENLLLFSPFALLLLLNKKAGWLGSVGRVSAFVVITFTLGALLGQLSPWLVQQNVHWLLLAAPVNFVGALIALAPNAVAKTAQS